MDRFLLRELATRRQPTPPRSVRYDERRQVSEVLEGELWVASWESSALENTKKADLETGEDQKGT
jgi:hypothetical protein